MNSITSPIRLIPADELLDFQREREPAQAQVRRWLRIIAEVDQAPAGQRGRVVAAIAKRIGKGASTIERKRAAYKKNGWQGLINRSKFPKPNTRGLPEAFRLWVPSLYSRFQRNNAGKQVWRYLTNRLEKWRATLAEEHAIPGYTSPPADGPEGYPVGWSYKRILDLRPATINLITARQGKKAASAYLPSNYTTRAGLKYGERFFFDDQVHDLKVNLLGRNSRAMRPLGFNALEHKSAVFSLYTSKLTLWEPEEKKSRTLTQRDFVWFNICHLLHVGYRTDSTGTTHIFEHGSGTGDPGFDDRIHAATNGHVTVWRGGRFTDPVFEGMLFRPQATGNFRTKSPLESIFNLDRNYMAALPGPVGSNQRLNGPEEHYGLDRYNTQLLKLWEKLSPERQKLVRFPYLSFAEFAALQSETYHLINSRTDHNLEGWEECEHIAPRFRLDPSQPWQDRDVLLDIDPERARAISDLAEWRTFPLSPLDVSAKHKHELTKLDLDLVPVLLKPEWLIDVSVGKNHEIHINDINVGSQPFIYLASIKGRIGRQTIPAGTKLKAHWHPLCGQHLWVFDLDGAYLGCLDQFIKPTAGDTPTIISNQAEINAIASDLNQWTRRNLGAVRDERQEMREHNRRLAAGEAVTPEERRLQSSRKSQETKRKNRLNTPDESIEPAGLEDFLHGHRDDFEPDTEPDEPSLKDLL